VWVLLLASHNLYQEEVIIASSTLSRVVGISQPLPRGSDYCILHLVPCCWQLKPPHQEEVIVASATLSLRLLFCSLHHNIQPPQQNQLLHLNTPISYQQPGPGPTPPHPSLRAALAAPPFFIHLPVWAFTPSMRARTCSWSPRYRPFSGAMASGCGMGLRFSSSS